MSDIMFSSVKNAIAWSEETAIAPDICSSMRLLTSTGGSTMNHNEAVDIARTITSITANCKPFKGMAAKAVYSSCSSAYEDRNLGIAIASNLLACGESNDKSAKQLIALGIGMVQTKRARELYYRRYPVKKIAAGVGVSREVFSRSKSWIALRNEAKERLDLLVHIAEVEIYSELSKLGFMM